MQALSDSDDIIVYSFEENYDVPNKPADSKLWIPTNNYFSSSQYHRNKMTNVRPAFFYTKAFVYNLVAICMIIINLLNHTV